jgi:hypothetical protein
MSPEPHPDDRDNFEIGKAVAFAISERESLGLAGFEHKRRGGGAWGLCDTITHIIKIEFRGRHVDESKRHKPCTLWNEMPRYLDDTMKTIAHELAHLRYQYHGKAHTAYTNELYADVRNLWIEYRRNAVRCPQCKALIAYVDGAFFDRYVRDDETSLIAPFCDEACADAYHGTKEVA